jgi:purine-binding chemotaxis protein CheW
MSEAVQAAPTQTPDPAADARQVLKERARALARPLEALVDNASRSVIVFSLGDERYAIETRYVFTVQRMCTVFPLPGAAAHVLGLTSVQGELLVVFDLRALLGTPRPAESDATRMIVLGDKHAELVIIADAVHEVQALYDKDLFPLPVPTAEGEKPCLFGVTNQAVSLFDGSALLSDPRLYVDESSAGPLP